MVEMSAELLSLFREEAGEYLDALTQGLLDLEMTPDVGEAKLREISRIAHSLKGAARTVNMHGIEHVAHHMETVLDATMQRGLVFSPEIADTMYDGLDVIRALMGGATQTEMQEHIDAVGVRLERFAVQARDSSEEVKTKAEPKPTPIKPPPPEAEHPVESTTIRVSINKLDALMAQASELLVSNINLEQRLDELMELSSRHARWRKAWRKVRPAFTRLKRDQETTYEQGELDSEMLQRNADLDALLDFVVLTQGYMRDTALRIGALEQTMNQDHLQLSMVTGELQDGVRRVRMLPFETILGGFQRMVRDLAREHGKEIIFNVIGEQVELDKRVLEAIRDPILHLLRNAIDHGIEPPEMREAAGKDPTGYLTLMVAQKGGEISVAVGDDGRGIDPERVKQSAIRTGRMAEADAELMDVAEAVDLIFLPGLSTKEKVTTLSGRGIGMDVVRQNVEGLRGHVSVQSQPGQGTTVRLTVPVSLTTMRCMLTQVGEEIYAIPIHAIEHILEVTPQDIHTVKGRQVVKLQDRPVTLVNLVDVLERKHRDEEDDHETQVALILKAGGKTAAFIVTDLVSEQELVVKSLGKEMERVRNVAGVTLLGTGEVVVILNVSDLLKSAQLSTRRYVVRSDAPEEAGPKARVLVVDDSITTRTLEKNILEAAGYEVITATDGKEAIDLVKHLDCDLIISDVEMPRMDGFALTQAVKDDETLKHLPLILVTSRDAPADRDRGMAVGADGYIVKGEFDQGELLETIGQLLG